jgi:hypothetical protein
MAHQHFCGDGGHHYDCARSGCMCFCDVRCDTGDHTDCPVELRACPEHEHGITTGELEAAKEAGAVPIQFPPDMPEKLSRVLRGSTPYAGFCIWCAYRYEEYSPKLEAEHFAYNCTDAPDELRENFRRQLHGRAAKSKKRCRKDRVSKN